MYRPGWTILLMYGSHDMRHTGFHRLTVVNGPPGFEASQHHSWSSLIITSQSQIKPQDMQILAKYPQALRLNGILNIYVKIIH